MTRSYAIGNCFSRCDGLISNLCWDLVFVFGSRRSTRRFTGSRFFAALGTFLLKRLAAEEAGKTIASSTGFFDRKSVFT